MNVSLCLVNSLGEQAEHAPASGPAGQPLLPVCQWLPGVDAEVGDSVQIRTSMLATVYLAGFGP